MTIYWQFIALLAVHWVADFVLQTHWQASNKSKNFEALSPHVCSYTAALGFGALIMFGTSVSFVSFVLANFMLHLVTDFCTSRVTSKLYAKGDIHNFFVVVGFDQLIHQVTIAVTLWFFFSYGDAQP